MKLRSLLLILTAVGLVMLSAAIGSTYWIVDRSPLNLLVGGVDRYPAAAMFLPKQTPVMTSLLVNPDRLASLRELAVPLGERKTARSQGDRLKENLLSSRGLNYYQDIQAWLGEEITLAVTSLDFDRDPSNGTQPGYLLVTSTKQPELARQFLQLSFSKQALSGNSDLIIEENRGVKILYKRPIDNRSDRENFASAVVGNFVLFANHPQVLKEAINNVQAPDLNLENAAFYQDAIATILEPRIGVAFINLPSLSAFLGKQAVTENPDIQQTVAVALSLKPGGLAAQTALIGVAGEENEQPVLQSPPALLQYIPSQTILTAAGKDLQHLWEQIDRGLNSESPLAQIFHRLVAATEKSLEVDLNKDIFNWVKEEYAISLLANDKSLDWLFLIPRNENTIPEIERLDRLAETKGLSIGKIDLEGSKVTAWTKLNTDKQKKSTNVDAIVKGVHTTIGNCEIFATSIGAIEQVLITGENSLLTSSDFTNAISSLPINNDGYLYLDWHRGEPILAKKVPLVKIIELAGQPLFERLNSLTLSSQGSQNGVRRATIFLNID